MPIVHGEIAPPSLGLRIKKFSRPSGPADAAAEAATTSDLGMKERTAAQAQQESHLHGKVSDGDAGSEDSGDLDHLDLQDHRRGEDRSNDGQRAGGRPESLPCFRPRLVSPAENGGRRKDARWTLYGGNLVDLLSELGEDDEDEDDAVNFGVDSDLGAEIYR